MQEFDYLEAAMAVADSQAPTVDRAGQRAPWLKSFSFSNGTFPIRLVSDSEKCPNGYHPHCKHSVQMKPIPNRKMTKEERDSYYNDILCTLSTHGTVPILGDDGKPVGSRLAEPCAVCDFYTDLQRSFGSFDENGKFLGIPEEKLDAGIQNALEDMRQGYCLSYLFPCLVKASSTKNKDGYDEYVPGSSVFLAILELKPGRYASDKQMLEQILVQKKLHPNLFSRSQGNWLSYTRNRRKTEMQAEDASELDSGMQALLKKYPNVISYGKGVDGIPGSNKVYSYDQAMYSFEDAWFFKNIRRKYPKYSLDGIERGLV